ncbi:MAG: HAD family hydrolase [Fusobacteriaceae bacterium]
MGKIQLVAFDLDGTLIRNIDSVSLLCNIKKVDTTIMREIDLKEKLKEISWIEADYERIKLIKGLELVKLYDEFNSKIEIIGGLKQLINNLKREKIKVILITAGPKQVAEIISKEYGFDYYFGSNYEVKDGRFTENILFHMGDFGKVKCLNEICSNLNISAKECMAIGDGISDVELFKVTGCSIALNPTEELEKYSNYSLNTENIMEIYSIILSEIK